MEGGKEEARGGWEGGNQGREGRGGREGMREGGNGGGREEAREEAIRLCRESVSGGREG